MAELKPDGERFLPGGNGPEIAYEHYARYLMAASIAHGQRVIDIGCGEGYGSYLLAKHADYVLGVDISEDAISHASGRYKRANLEYLTASALNIDSFENSSFSMVTCFEVIEHVDTAQQHKILSTISRLLTPNGILLISTPNHDVYQQAGGAEFNNQFHLREMNFVEFRDLLNTYFNSIVWFNQCPLSGNLLRRFSPIGDLHKGLIETAEVDDNGLLYPESTPSISEAKYFFAICARDKQTLSTIEIPGGMIFTDVRGTLSQHNNNKIKKLAFLEEKNRISNTNIIQIFYDTGRGFSEEKSDKKYIELTNSDIYTFIFPISDKKNIKALRFDPIDTPAVIYIKNISLIGNSKEFDLTDHIRSNAIIIEGNTYYFSTNDPNITFSEIQSIDYNIYNNISIDIKYLHTGLKASLICNNLLARLNSETCVKLSESNVKLSETTSIFNETCKKLSDVNVQLDKTHTMLSERNIFIKGLEGKIETANFTISSLGSKLSEAVSDKNNLIEKLDNNEKELSSKIALLIKSQRQRLEVEHTNRYFIKLCNKIYKLILNPRKRYSYYKKRKIIINSNLFNPDHYLACNEDLILTCFNLIEHYLTYGWLEGRNPNQLFDIKYYLEKNPDVKKAGAEPFCHYITHGWRENRNPGPLFDVKYYLDNNPDIERAGIEPLSHYLSHGWRENRNPNPLFNTKYYLDNNPDVKNAGTEPLCHYIAYGWREGRNPNPLFDVKYYINSNQDIQKTGIEPLSHYLIHGWHEGRNPNPLFDVKYYLDSNPEFEPLAHYLSEGWRRYINPNPLFDVKYYLESYPDVKSSGVEPLYHYISYGWREGRNPNPLFDVNFYLENYPDVKYSGVEPLYHYIAYGSLEGRNPSLNFNNKEYFLENPDLNNAVNPLAHFFNSNKQENEIEVISDKNKFNIASQLNIVPTYIVPIENKCLQNINSNISIAIHLHLYYEDMLPEIIKYLQNIPYNFDLYVSINKSLDIDSLKTLFINNINKLNAVIIKLCPNKGRDIGPFIILFGRDLLKYKIISHIHTKKSIQNEKLSNWFEMLATSLFGSPAAIEQIINLLEKDGKIVFPEQNENIRENYSNWGDNYSIAETLLKKFTTFNIHDFPVIEFPRGFMFWASSSCLKEYLSLPLTWDDFPDEPISEDGTLAHALERLLFIFASKDIRKNYCIHKRDSIKDYKYYEEQQDYSNGIKHSNIKLLSYYLPQFHPIPENDKWHGDNFTEWTKVKAAQPLFYGHYQQHIPHEDIGYYLLDSPEILFKQANIMRKAGVYGQIFYHYWFSGKLILERPAQILLANKNIPMPFCFCWANENWTKCWDGNEIDILLKQDYSEQDARNFINYLIPFFKDDRYIKIENRPVLLIYRASSFPDFKLYKNIWDCECEKNGIAVPFLITVLTRGATHPNEYNMDAGVERVLHDWTAGKVPDIKSKLYQYVKLNGSVLSYRKVANFYINQNEKKPFIYFRSMIPNWDNSARYGKEAYILHGSTPEIFQEWLEKLIQYSENHLPLDKQFIIVNAWNEWAEGTHLEPDTRFGYSYLNSIGRALSNVSYDHYPSNSEIEIPSKINLKIDISNFLENKLVNNIENGNKFIACLAHSNIFNACNVIIDNKLLIDKLDDFTNGMKLNIKVDDFSDYTCLIEDLSYFSNDLIDNLLKKAIYYKNSTICANVLYNSYPSFSCKTTSNRSIDSFNAFGIKLFSNKFQIHKNHRIFPDDICIIPGNDQDYQYDIADKNDVTTIIRFHNTGDQSLLKIALISLFSQNGCNVLPYIAIQDFDDNKYSNLVNLICQFPWQNNCRPIIKKFYANESITDLRSKMLNESLKNISTRFVAFLDYDDFLFPYAYKWLLNRIKTTGKAISFGNLYVTYFNRKDKSIIKRIKAFEYGTNYYDFIKINHTPIHGFMIDLTKVDLNNIKYYDDMKYMEDYYFTLQIFNENNCDWDSLKHKTYIGDYFHSVDAEQTLAFTEDRKRFKTISNSDYIKSEKRINDLRYEINKNIYLKKNG